MITKDFILAGRAVFTVDIPSTFKTAGKSHYTYKVVKKEDTTGKYNTTYFVNLLTGPDNRTDYTYMGILDEITGTIRLTKKSKFEEDSWPLVILSRVIFRIWRNEGHEITKHNWDVHHEGRCGRCGRALTTPESCLAGIGPECIKFVGKGI